MGRSTWKRIFYGCSLTCAALPFAFGLIRVMQTGSDFRFLWMALASFLGGSAVLAIGQPRCRRPRLGLLIAAVAFATAIVLAAATAFMLGASSAPASWAVAVAFGLCLAAAYVLNVLSLPRAM